MTLRGARILSLAERLLPARIQLHGSALQTQPCSRKPGHSCSSATWPAGREANWARCVLQGPFQSLRLTPGGRQDPTHVPSDPKSPPDSSPRGPPGLTHLALVALFVFVAKVDGRQAGQVESGARARAWGPQQKQRQQEKPRPPRWRRRRQPRAHDGCFGKRAAEPRGRKGKGLGGSETTRPLELRQAVPATDSSGCVRRHRGSRNRNRTGPQRSMRGVACTCSVRATASTRELPGGSVDEIHFPGFQ